ncbi:unnamed protein product [Amoebophrya sp. A120]|nr:unnamed protein product [Amoebophrya sp. A120]|eukprot:GSA120T00015926001.1
MLPRSQRTCWTVVFQQDGSNKDKASLGQKTPNDHATAGAPGGPRTSTTSPRRPPCSPQQKNSLSEADALLLLKLEFDVDPRSPRFTSDLVSRPHNSAVEESYNALKTWKLEVEHNSSEIQRVEVVEKPALDFSPGLVVGEHHDILHDVLYNLRIFTAQQPHTAIELFLVAHRKGGIGVWADDGETEGARWTTNEENCHGAQQCCFSVSLCRKQDAAANEVDKSRSCCTRTSPRLRLPFTRLVPVEEVERLERTTTTTEPPQVVEDQGKMMKNVDKDFALASSRATSPPTPTTSKQQKLLPKSWHDFFGKRFVPLVGTSKSSKAPVSYGRKMILKKFSQARGARGVLCCTGRGGGGGETRQAERLVEEKTTVGEQETSANKKVYTTTQILCCVQVDEVREQQLHRKMVSKPSKLPALHPLSSTPSTVASARNGINHHTGTFFLANNTPASDTKQDHREKKNLHEILDEQIEKASVLLEELDAHLSQDEISTTCLFRCPSQGDLSCVRSFKGVEEEIERAEDVELQADHLCQAKDDVDALEDEEQLDQVLTASVCSTPVGGSASSDLSCDFRRSSTGWSRSPASKTANLGTRRSGTTTTDAEQKLQNDGSFVTTNKHFHQQHQFLSVPPLNMDRMYARKRPVGKSGSAAGFSSTSHAAKVDTDLLVVPPLTKQYVRSCVSPDASFASNRDVDAVLSGRTSRRDVEQVVVPTPRPPVPFETFLRETAMTTPRFKGSARRNGGNNGAVEDAGVLLSRVSGGDGVATKKVPISFPTVPQFEDHTW